MAGAHSSVARAIDGGMITLAHHFLECLEDPEQRSAASTIAVRLHLDPAGDFIGLVWRPDSDRTDLAGHGTVSPLPPQHADDVVRRSVAGGRMEMITQSERVPAPVASGVEAEIGGASCRERVCKAV